MATQTKRATIYFDPNLHKALRLKSVETPTKTLKEYIEELDNSQIVNLLDSLLERLEE